MAKKIIFGALVVFVVWTLLDLLIHSVVLRSSYEMTAHLWRPAAEMKFGLMGVVSLLTALAFTAMYALCVSPKDMSQAVRFGLLYGLAVGTGMGYGTFSVLPVPYHMALIWFLGTAAQGIFAGVVVGKLIKE